MFARSSVFSGLAILLLTSPVLSDTITTIDVPNFSFENPDIGTDPPYASQDLADWQKNAPPPYWAFIPNTTTDEWYQSSGIFYNSPTSQTVDNAVGPQMGFEFANPGLQISQDLSSTYQPGQSYQLTVGIQGGGGGMVAGCPMDLELYYRDDGGNQVPVGDYTFENDNVLPPGGYISHLVDRVLTIPTVSDNDAWAGKQIGVALIQTTDFSTAGGYWDMDNVRLVSVPEPGSMGLLAAAGFSIFMLGRRRLLAKQTAAAHD